MAGKFEIYKDRAGEYRFRLKAANGEIILASEAYKSRSGVTNGVKSVRVNAQDANKFQKVVTRSGKYRFNLKAGNHHVIGTSQNYDSDSSRNRAIKSVAKTISDAELRIQIIDPGTGSPGPRKQ